MGTTFGNYPANYLLFNQQLSKQLCIVMIIEDVPYVFGIADTYQTVRYGDFGITYGLPGLVYGGLRKIGGPNGVNGIQPWIMLDGGMSIQQRIEPEQGKGNIGTLTMTLIDYQQQLSYIIAPGNVVDEIISGKQVTIYLGFQQTSYPEDYLIIYRGYITSIDCPPGIVRFQISDATMKARQPICATPTTVTTSAIDTIQTNIPVTSNTGFYIQIQGPDETYLSTVHTYIAIDSEFMEYGLNGLPDSTDFTVTRASLGSVAATHDSDATVSNTIQFGDTATGVNFITLALQLLLSGWDGPCETGLTLLTLGFVTTPVSNAFLLSLDALLDVGLTAGDYFYITGATNLANNISGIITGFGVYNSFNKIVYTNQTFIAENPTTATVSFRSKYDVLPVLAGSSCRMRDVDVSTMEQVRSDYFSSSIYLVAMYYDAQVFAKDTIATDLFLPMGCYQISRYGRISMSIAKPPLPGIGKLVQLDYTNILDPDKIHVTRATNQRTFYNSISYQYDYSPVSNDYATVQYFIDTDSLNLFNQTLALPITAKALKTSLGGGSIAGIRGQALLTRYKNIALMIELTVNWSVGSLIEVSDVALIVDNGTLQIMNFDTGLRNLGSALFEVIDRTFNITAGNVKLKLLSGLGFSANSRFGLISPSTILGTGCTTTLLNLTPSFGQTNLTNEIAKYSSYFGLPIVVHSTDYSVIGTATLVSINAANPGAFNIFPALNFTPQTGYILEIADYPTDTNKNTNSQYKALYCYISPTVSIVSGISTTEFTVSSNDIGKFLVGGLLIIRTLSYTNYSGEQTITVVNTSTNTITVNKSLLNVPDTTYVAELIGFQDGNGAYRYD